MERLLTCAVLGKDEQNVKTVTRLVESHPNLELVASFNPDNNWIQKLQENKVDLLIMDILSREPDYSSDLEHLQYRPATIVTTDDPQQTLSTLKFQVTDYIKQPIIKSFFLHSIERVLISRKLQQRIEENDDPSITIRSNRKDHKLRLSDILFVEAMGDYLKVVTASDEFVVLSTMKSLMQQLNSPDFMRIHKSYILNLKGIASYDNKVVTVKNLNTTLPISRSKKKTFKEVASKYTVENV